MKKLFLCFVLISLSLYVNKTIAQDQKVIQSNQAWGAASCLEFVYHVKYEGAQDALPASSFWETPEGYICCFVRAIEGKNKIAMEIQNLGNEIIINDRLLFIFFVNKAIVSERADKNYEVSYDWSDINDIYMVQLGNKNAREYGISELAQIDDRQISFNINYSSKCLHKDSAPLVYLNQIEIPYSKIIDNYIRGNSDLHKIMSPNFLEEPLSFIKGTLQGNYTFFLARTPIVNDSCVDMWGIGNPKSLSFKMGYRKIEMPVKMNASRKSFEEVDILNALEELGEECQKFYKSEAKWPDSLDTLLQWQKKHSRKICLAKGIFKEISFKSLSNKGLQITYILNSDGIYVQLDIAPPE